MAQNTGFGPSFSLLAARVLTVSGAAIAKVQLRYAREYAPNPNITTLSFEGDNTSQQVDLESRVEVELTCDKLDLYDLQIIFGKQTTTGVSGEAYGMNWGDVTEEAGVLAGLEVDIAFKDESVTPNVAHTLRHTWYKGVLKLRRIQPVQYQGKYQTKLNFVFQRTTTDLINVAIPTAPSDGYGAYMREAVLT
jgi:hypothetical protein